MDMQSHQRWFVLAAGFFANAIFSVAATGIPAIAILLQHTYSLTPQQLGLVLGMIALGIAVSEILWGVLTDWLGDRRVLQIGLVGLIILFACMAISSQHLIYLLFLVGFLGGSINGASGRAIMVWFNHQEHGLAMSIRQTALPIGGALGAVILPFIASHFGFTAVYGTLCGLNILALILVFVWLKEPQHTEEQHIISENGLKTTAFWRTVLFSSVMCFPQIAMVVFAAVFLHQVCALSLLQTSIVMMIIQLGAGASRIFVGYWTDRKQNRTIVLSQIPFVLVILFLLLSTLTYFKIQMAITITFIVTAIIASCWNGLAYTQMAVLAQKQYVGRGLGIANTFVFGSFFITTAIVPHIARWENVWLTALGCAIISLILLPLPYFNFKKTVKY